MKDKTKLDYAAGLWVFYWRAFVQHGFMPITA
jgi:hypothetical protein